jgi:hypothetical protein
VSDRAIKTCSQRSGGAMRRGSELLLGVWAQTGLEEVFYTAVALRPGAQPGARCGWLPAPRESWAVSPAPVGPRCCVLAALGSSTITRLSIAFCVRCVFVVLHSVCLSCAPPALQPPLNGLLICSHGALLTLRVLGLAAEALLAQCRPVPMGPACTSTTLNQQPGPSPLQCSETPVGRHFPAASSIFGADASPEWWRQDQN